MWAFTRRRGDNKRCHELCSRFQSAWNLNLGLKDHLSPASPEATKWNPAIIYFIIQTSAFLAVKKNRHMISKFGHFVLMKTSISKTWISSDSCFSSTTNTADSRRSVTPLKSASTLFVAEVLPLPYLPIIRCFMSSNTPL